jgi:hypothetical protein
MAGSGSKWLAGCGIGCGLLLLVMIAVAVGATLFVRDAFKGFGAAIETRGDLEERFGQAGDFTPWPDGTIPPERIEAFLGARDATAAAREQIASKFAAIPMSEAEARALDEKPAGQKALSVFKIVGSAFGLAGELGDFFEARNRALLERGMGLGEYTFLYTVTFYAWLGHSPDDGPQTGRDDDDRVNVKFSERDVQRRVHDDLLSMLRNQLRAVAPGAPEEWRERLAAEIETLERHRRRFAWQDGLPAATEASLEPYRERLELSYDPASNPFELTVTRKQGRYSITTE